MCECVISINLCVGRPACLCARVLKRGVETLRLLLHCCPQGFHPKLRALLLELSHQVVGWSGPKQCYFAPMRKSALLARRATPSVAPPQPTPSLPNVELPTSSSGGQRWAHETIYMNPRKKKDGSRDGFLIFTPGKKLVLHNDGGTEVASKTLVPKDELLTSGDSIRVGPWECEIGDVVPVSSFDSGAALGCGSMPTPASAPGPASAVGAAPPPRRPLHPVQSSRCSAVPAAEPGALWWPSVEEPSVGSSSTTPYQPPPAPAPTPAPGPAPAPAHHPSLRQCVRRLTPPPAALVAIARRALRVAAARCGGELYLARVNLLPTNTTPTPTPAPTPKPNPNPNPNQVDLLPSTAAGGWLVSELELGWPELFLRANPAAARRVAAALLHHLPPERLTPRMRAAQEAEAAEAAEPEPEEAEEAEEAEEEEEQEAEGPLSRVGGAPPAAKRARLRTAGMDGSWHGS